MAVIKRFIRETQAQMPKKIAGLIISLATIFALLDLLTDGSSMKREVP